MATAKTTYVSGNGYRVVTKKDDAFIGSMRFSDYNKALSQTALVARKVNDCTVMLLKLDKGRLKLMALYEKGRKVS